MPIKLLFEDIKKEIGKAKGFLLNNLESDVIYKNKKIFVNIVDEKGYKYFARYEDIKKYFSLPHIVHISNPYSLENISLWLKLNNKNFELCNKDNSIYRGNKEELKFKCHKCNEEFFTDWSHVYLGQNCSICSGKQVSETTSLKYLRPEIAKEWLKSKNNLEPSEVTEFSNKKVYWKCSDCGHEWWATICSRTKGKRGCGVCAGQIVSDKNRLSIIRPELISEWHPTKNGDLTPENVSFGSGRKVWWICRKCSCEWTTAISNRSNGRDCPNCADLQKESKIANKLKEYILQNYKSEVEYKIFKNPKTNQYLPFDIYIYNNIFIEIHGLQHYVFVKYWHKNQEGFEYSQYKDKIKKCYAQENGLYIEVDLRKIKTIDNAIKHIKKQLKRRIIN